MFRKNHEHEQESLFSPVKDLSPPLKRKLDRHWSSYFYQHVFTQIDETTFEGLYHDGYSRPNKPVNELVSLEILKHLMGLSDEELEHAYLFDFRVRNALGKESLGDNICPKTFTNFRRRLLEYEKETGRSLLHEVFTEHRDYLQEEFNIDASTQRMDSTLVQANIKELSRMDLIGKVVYNFLHDLPEDHLEDLPADMEAFGAREKSELSYGLAPEDAAAAKETLAEWAGWLVDHFESHEGYNELDSFGYLRRVLDEQCYWIPELEEEDEDEDEADAVAAGDHDDDDDEGSPGWEPHRTLGSIIEDDDVPEGEEDPPDSDEDHQPRIGLKNPEEIPSDSLHSPHDDEATYRRKHGEEYFGYVINLAETCGGENPFRLITAVRVDTNNTDDGDLLDRDVADLAGMGLTDLLNDGGYTHKVAEAHCLEQGITQHFTGIKGTAPPEGTLSLAEFEWDGYELLACAAGHEPLSQSQSQKGRISFRMAKEHCESCEYKESCRVEEKQNWYSYGFWERKLDIAERRARLTDPESEAFLNQRAGAESMIYEVYHKTGKRTRFTGTTKVKNASIAKAIGTNLKRVAGHLNEETGPSKTAA